MTLEAIQKRFLRLCQTLTGWRRKPSAPPRPPMPTSSAKGNGVLVKLTPDGWLIGDVLWDAEFARAMVPVEYQRILAISLRKRARRAKTMAAKIHFFEKAKLLERQAEADAQCEIKWGARKV